MTQSIKLESLRDLVSMGAITTATILGQKGGFAVLAKLGGQDRILATKLGEVKMFATTDTAVRELSRLGLSSFIVDTSNYVKSLMRAPRHDVSARAKEAANALAYDRWVREQVDEALAEENNGTTAWQAHDAVWSEVLAETVSLTAARDDTTVKTAVATVAKRPKSPSKRKSTAKPKARVAAMKKRE